MSLSKLPADLITALSGKLDGVGFVNLAKCGSKVLNASLRKSLPCLYFEVNHYGFLNIPQVLASLGNLFPLARSHTFVDLGRKGCQSQLDVTCAHVDLALLEATRLNVTSFNYVGSGAFIRMMNQCLSKVESKLNDIFPCVVDWNAGRFVDLLPTNTLLSSGPLDPLTSTFKAVVPSSATNVRVSSPTSPFYLNGKQQPLYKLALTATSIDSTLFASTPSFRSLTVLWICYDGILNARDLPRGLTSFIAGSSLLIQRGSGTIQSMLILSDPPPGLEHLQLSSYNRLVFPRDEFAPLACLKSLDASRASDLSHRLSAYKLPKSLTLLYVGQLTTSMQGDDATSVQLDEHLFANIHDDGWVSAWPTRIRIERLDTTDNMAEEMNVLMERLLPFVDNESCRYTLRCLLEDDFASEETPAKIELKQRIGCLSFQKDTLPSLLSDASHYVDGLFLRGEILELLYDALQPGKIIASKDLFPLITTVSINNTTDKKEDYDRLTFIRDNIHKLCPCIATLRYFNYVDDLPIASSIRELTIDQFPTRPLNIVSSESGQKRGIVSSDSLESLTITAEKQLISIMSLERMALSLNQNCRFVRDKIPQFLFELPSRLVTLEVQFATGEVQLILARLREWLPSLPKTLLYLHLKRRYTDRAFEFVPQEGDAALLPPHLRLINWSIFFATHNRTGSFCKQVAHIPSLSRLIMVLSDKGKPGMMGPLSSTYGHTLHCFSFARNFVENAEEPSDALMEWKGRGRHSTTISSGLIISCLAICAFVIGGIVITPIIALVCVWRYFA